MDQSTPHKDMIKQRAYLYVVASLMACVYVLAYNEVEWARMHGARAVACGGVRIFVSLQWAVMSIPVGVGLLCRARPEGRLVAIVPDLLGFFSVFWVSLAIFVWRLQASVETVLE